MKKRANYGLSFGFCIGLMAFCAAVPGLSGCAKSAEAANKVEPVYPVAIDKDDWEAVQKYREENEAEETFLKAEQEFTFKTSQALLQNRKPNAVYSPVSLYYALILAASGTSGETAEELYGFLEVKTPETAVEEAGKLYRTLYKDGEIGKVHIATSLWTGEALMLKKKFKDAAAGDLYASIHSVDFKSEQTAKQMSEWVKDQTQGTIAPDITLAPNQVMSILNTIYFYDEWQNRFQKDQTETGAFYLADGGTAEAEFMNSKYGSHSFTKGDHYTRSELPLKTNGSMVFVLPDEDVFLEELLKSPEALQNALEGGTNQMGEVIFQVPKFTMDSNFDVKEMMETFGITKIFTGGDFSAMTDNKEIGITKISQDGHISINEEGVEASAFTELQYTGAALPKGRADMILNRPFLFGIRDKHARIDGQQTWLFIGVCDNPSVS